MKPLTIFRTTRLVLFGVALSLAVGTQTFADQLEANEAASESTSAVETSTFALESDVDALWVCLAAFLVFFMQIYTVFAVITGITAHYNDARRAGREQ